MLPEHLMERNEKAQIDLVSLSQDPYAVYRNECVEVKSNNFKVNGVYRGMTRNGQLILTPHLVWSPTLSDRQLAIPFLSELPLSLSNEHIVGMYPRNYKEIERLVKREREVLLEGLMEDPACYI